MPSLRQLLAAHAPILLFDAASARVQVGWLNADTSLVRWASSEEESGVGVFRCLESLGVKPAEAGAFLFCDGPGSVLGVRTVAIAIRAWCVLRPRPVFAYHSLAVVAHVLDRPELSIIADARRDTWHVASLAEPLHRLPGAELTGELVTPDGFRHWSPLPANVTRVPYSLAEMLPQVMDRDLFRATDAPDAFLHEEPSYMTWTPKIHRAP